MQMLLPFPVQACGVSLGGLRREENQPGAAPPPLSPS